MTHAPEPYAQPAALSGFEHIRRYWDNTHQTFAAKIMPGEFYVTCRDEAIITSLGSCVSACIRDRESGVGGMNHFMLPHAGDSGAAGGACISDAARYGSFAMEQLINEILKAGGRRENLEVKLAGGGHVLANMHSDIGARNIEFVRNYLSQEGLQLLGEDLGGHAPRRVVYFPASGKVRVRKLRGQSIVSQERSYRERISQRPVAGDIELF